mgnify:FL=1
MKSKNKRKKLTSLGVLLSKHPEWILHPVTHESMLNMGYGEAFRVKATHPLVKDEIWYKKMS